MKLSRSIKVAVVALAATAVATSTAFAAVTIQAGGSSFRRAYQAKVVGGSVFA